MREENSNELRKTKLYYATRRHCICVQNKNYVCLHAAHTLEARHMTQLCIYQALMAIPVLDGVKLITLPIFRTSEPDSWFCLKKKSINSWTRSRPTSTFSESNDWVRDDRKTSRVRTVLQPYLESTASIFQVNILHVKTDISRHTILIKSDIKTYLGFILRNVHCAQVLLLLIFISASLEQYDSKYVDRL